MKLLTIPEAAALLACSKTHVYDLIADGALPAVDISRPGAKRSKTRVTAAALESYVGRHTRVAA